MLYFTDEELSLGGNFIMLCGAPGSGKTEYADRIKSQYNGNWTVVSFEKIRNDISAKSDSGFSIAKVFDKISDTIRTLLENQQNVIYIANNCNSRDRKNVMKAVNFTDSEGTSLCLVSQASLLTCLKRNAAHGNNTPEEIIERLYIQLKHTVPALYEGYDFVGRFDVV